MADDTTPPGRMRGRTPDSAKIKIKGKWTAIPNRMLTDQRLSRDARLLGCLLFMHAGNSGKTFPSQEELAAEMSFTAQVAVTDEQGKTQKDADGRLITQEARRDITTRSIQRWLSELRAAGWLDWRQTMRNNEYTLLDPGESDGVTTTTSSDASLNIGLNGATAVSHEATEGSHEDATEGSHGATPVSRWNTTEGSPSNATERSGSDTTEGSSDTTEGSSPLIAVSQSSSYKDSLILDSSSRKRTIDDDEGTSPHTESSRYLAEKGVSVALEFRDLPLPIIERTWHDVMGRDNSATPGAVVIALRSIAAARAAAPPPAAVVDDDELPPPAPPTARAVGAQDQRMVQLWQATMEKLQARLPGPEFDAWLHDTALLNLDGGVATILVSTAFHKESLENRYLAPIRRALGELLGAPVQARVVFAPPDVG
jgi:hypothetical protein